MIWKIVEIGLGVYVGLCVAAKNPSVASAIKEFHDKVVSWVYMWLPRLVMWLYNFIKDRI
jgi:hypothetical protein